MADQWLTYDDLAERLGITRNAARVLAQRRAWRRQTSNDDGKARVLVDLDALRPAVPRHGPARAPEPEAPDTLIAELRARIGDQAEQIAMLRAQAAEHQAERARWHDTLDSIGKRAAEDRAADRKRIDELERLLDRERSAGLWARLFGRR